MGLLAPSIMSGGAERWMLSLARYCDPMHIVWSTCVITGLQHDGFMLAAMANLMPTYYMDHSYHRDRRTQCTLRNAITRLADQSDVVIVWELDYDMLVALDAIPKPIIYVAHRANTHAYMRDHYHLAAVSQNCTISFGERRLEAKVIHNGIDLNRLFPLQSRSTVRTQWRVPDDFIVIGYIGRIDREKNCVAIARAIEAMARPARAICCGGLAFQGDDIVRRMSCIAGDKLAVIEPTDDIGSVLHAIDVFILPSYTEACSLSLLEAWGAGVPVVATRVGIFPELEERYGRLAVSISPDDTGERLANALEEALFDPGMSGVVARARDLVFRDFNVLNMAQRWTEYITSITGGESLT